MNLFYLIGGIISIFLSVAHAFWGEKNLTSDLESSNVPEETIISYSIAWHQISKNLLVTGVTLIVISFLDLIMGIYILALFITIQVIGNILVYSLILLIKKKSDLFKKTLPQLLIFAIMVVFILLGIFV
ncbi:MAG: hypothetical protein KGD65_11850 [Candidatus Lokiarchaeota archaeon]|nr:hypothetical protein [Candidatus Lokiarchaeota archaeon]